MDFWQYLWKWVSTSFSVPVRATEIAVLLVTLIGLFVGQRIPKWSEPMKTIAWAIPLGVLILVLVGSLIGTAYNIYKTDQKTIATLNSQLQTVSAKNFATPNQLIGNSLNNLTININDLARENPTISAITFTNCKIYGPAVLFADQTNVFNNVSFYYGNATPDSMLIVTSNPVIIGAIQLQYCVFTNCQFYQLAFIGNAQNMATMKAAITWNP